MSRLNQMMIALIFLGNFAVAETWVLPWVSNNEGNWSSEIAINNHDDEAVSLTLMAIRPDGSQETMGPVMIPAYGQMVKTAAQLFPTLGSGGGYAIYISGENANISAAVKLSSTRSDSGDSPALAHAAREDAASDELSFQLMKYQTGANAAPVVVNPNDVAIQVTFLAFNHQGSLVGELTERIEAHRPYANLMSSMFPLVSEDTYLIARGELPIVGMAFAFNGQNEPSTMNAEPVIQEITEEQLSAFIASLETIGSAGANYANATSGLFDKQKTLAPKDTCPLVEVDINLTNSDRFIEALFDWGSGCTNLFGVWSKGSISLNMIREGIGTSGAWMNGTLAFNDYEVRYLASNFALNGEIHAEGSIRSDNFNLAGQWEASAVSPLYGVHASYQSQSFLNINDKGDYYTAYGYLSVTASNYTLFTLEGKIIENDPLKYDFETCMWPYDGAIELAITWGYKMTGKLDFDTPDCNTAYLTVAGQTVEIYLPGIYPQ